MFSFINFATVIVFLVTMFDDSTQLVTVPRSLPDPIAELCRALVVLKRERYQRPFARTCDPRCHSESPDGASA